MSDSNQFASMAGERGSQRSRFCFAGVEDRDSYRGMSIGVDGGPRFVLSKPEMRELFQFLMREARNFEDVCCWHGCRHSGRLYRIRGVSVRAVRYYCDRHALAVELAGFRVFPADETA